MPVILATLLLTLSQTWPSVPSNESLLEQENNKILELAKTVNALQERYKNELLAFAQDKKEILPEFVKFDGNQRISGIAYVCQLQNDWLVLYQRLYAYTHTPDDADQSKSSLVGDMQFTHGITLLKQLEELVEIVLKLKEDSIIEQASTLPAPKASKKSEKNSLQPFPVIKMQEKNDNQLPCFSPLLNFILERQKQTEKLHQEWLLKIAYRE